MVEQAPRGSSSNIAYSAFDGRPTYGRVARLRGVVADARKFRSRTMDRRRSLVEGPPPLIYRGSGESLPSSWRGDGALAAWDPRDSLVCLLFLHFRFPSPRFSSPFFNFYLIVVLLFFLESKYLRTPHVVLAPSIISVFWTHSCHRYLGVPRLRADQPSLPRGYSAFQYNPLCGDPSV